MSDPADKSDDLMAELAKLMATPPAGGQSATPAVPRPAPLAAAPAAQPAPTIRIPGMPTPAAPAAAHPEQRAPVVGAIRIPGMDQPAPVSTSAPVSKFDFGKPVAATPIKQEPLSTLSERLAAQSPAPAPRVEGFSGINPAPNPTPIRLPSDLRPVSENKSFGQGPAIAVAPAVSAPAAPAAPSLEASRGDDFNFDFGFGRNPPKSDTPPRPTPEAEADADFDPIADLIAAELDEADEPETPQLQREQRPAPAPVAPVIRTAVTPQPSPPKATFAPMSSAPSRPASNAPVPLKPVSVAPRAPEADRFAISPGVGLNMKPAAGQALSAPVQRAPEPARPSYDDSDPMSEIESLIGEAVRVELSAPGPVRVQAAPQITPHVEFEPSVDFDADEDEPVPARSEAPAPAPIVPPLTTQFAPRRANLKEEGGRTAEDAILAAAAATGAQVDRLEPSVSDESPYRRLKVKPAKASFMSGGLRQYVGMAVAGTLLLAAGLGLYWVLNMGRSGDAATGTDAPQLTADVTPVKEVPTTPVVEETDAARSPVLEQMGGTSVEPSVEQLVSTDETADAPVARDVTQVAAADADTEGGLANRKVRTVTVRPDGTIVSGDDALAGAEELPVDRPNVPAVPETEGTNLLGDSTAVAMTDPVADNTALAPLTAAGTTPTTTATTDTAALQPVFDPTIVAPKPISFPVRSANIAAFSPEPAAPTEITGAQTPNGQIDLLAGTTEVAAAPATPVQSSNTGAGAYVQLSSSPSEADAQASVRSMTNRYGSLFGGNQLTIQSADLGQKGTWYRVRLPVGSLSDAQAICQNIKANGGDCIVSGG